ncbi:Leucine-rich repeat [Trypanosoma melophagium]|uniref:Leucine-rich repeat n=1 Tax=Trypanosoma melophagium TaxID=715481 RepID=UPI00351A9598|nr:Leucine-rich repeat [Trypanosoma melophagium]
MRRFVKHISARNPAYRWRWTLNKVAALSHSTDLLLSSIHQSAREEMDWDLDFSLLPYSTQGDNVHEMLQFCTSTAISAAAQSVERLSLTVNSPTVGLVLTRMFCTASFASLRTLELTLHDTAFLYENGTLAALLYAAAESVSSRLESLRITFVMTDMTRSLQWSHEATMSLAALISTATLRRLSLEYINLHGTTEKDLMIIANAIAHSHTMEHFSLRGSRNFTSRVSFLRSVIICMRHLEVVDFSSTLLGDTQAVQLINSLKEAIGGWYRLRRLSLAETNISTWAMQLLLRDIAELPSDESAKLEYLDLSSNGIDDEGAFVLASCCMRCEKMCELYLRHNRISKKSASALGSALISAASLRSLNLHTNPLGDEGLNGLLQHAKYWTDLRSLNLTRCRLTAHCLITLSSVLPLFEKMQELTLDRNDMRPLKRKGENGKGNDTEGDLQLFAYDPRFMQCGRYGNSKVLTSFELDRRDATDGRRRFKGTEEYRVEDKTCKNNTNSHNEEEDDGNDDTVLFQRFGSALSGCRELRRLSLSDCSLTDASFTALATALVVRQLTHLDLSANPLFAQMKSLEALDMLLHLASPSLEELDLSCTGLGSIGVSLLADGPMAPHFDEEQKGGESALRLLKTLKQLRLSNCCIGTDGFEALTDAISTLVSLERLFLDSNKVNEASTVISLLGSLAVLPLLKFVGLYGCVTHNCTFLITESQEYVALQRKGVVIHL